MDAGSGGSMDQKVIAAGMQKVVEESQRYSGSSDTSTGGCCWSVGIKC